MKKLLIIFLCLISLRSFAVINKWYKATTGTNYSTLANWYLDALWTVPAIQIPAATDSVQFIAGAGNCIIDVASVCYSANLSAWDGILTGTAGWTISGQLTCGGTMSGYTGTITFNATSTGWKITSNGKTFGGHISFNRSGGGWTIMDNLTCNNMTFSNGSLTLTSGITVSPWGFTSITGTRTLTMTGAIMTCTGSNTNGGLINIQGTMTYDGAGTWNSTGANFLVICDRTLTTLNLTGSGVAGIYTTTGCIITNFNRTGTGVKTDGLNIGVNCTLGQVGGSCTIKGNSITNRLLMRTGTVYNAFTYGTPYTVTVGGTLDIQNVDFMDIAMSPSTDLSAYSSGDCGGNSGITFTSPVNCFWVSDNGSWSTASMWKTLSGGSITQRVPLPQDSCIFDANSFSTTGKTVTCDMPRMSRGICFTDVGTDNPALVTLATEENYGSFILHSGMTWTTNTAMSLAGRNYYTFNDAGVSLNTTLYLRTSNTLSFTNNSKRSVQVKSGTTQTFTTLNCNGTSASNLVTFTSSTPGTYYTFSKSSGTVMCDFLSLTDCHTTGGAFPWYALHSTNVSGNAGWMWAVPQTQIISN